MSTEQRPWPNTGRGKTSPDSAHLRENARHTFGTRRRAGDPSAGKRQSVRHSTLIVGNPRWLRPLRASPRFAAVNSNRKMRVTQYRICYVLVMAGDPILAGHYWVQGTPRTYSGALLAAIAVAMLL